MDKLEVIVRSLNNHFAKDIVAIDMKLVSPLFDTFVICSAENARLMNAIQDHVIDEMAKNSFEPKHVEGAKDSQWILLDYGDIIIHIFSPEERYHYHLEKLWGDQHRIDISAYLTAKKNEL